MNTYIALLRGINVGGRNRLPMKNLTAILEGVGCQGIRTYIQSGNVVFRGSSEAAAAVSDDIPSAIEKLHGFTPYILVLPYEKILHAIAMNPYPEAEADPKTVHVGFLESKPPSPKIEKLDSIAVDSERFQLTDNLFYLHAPDGIGRSKLAANAERLIGVAMTSRNWRTVCMIRDLAEEVQG